MGRNSQKRRAEKKAKKALKAKEKKKADSSSLKGVKVKEKAHFYHFENPFEGLSDEQITDAKREVATHSKKIYQDSLDHLKGLVKKYNPFLLLSVLAGYSVLVPVTDDGIRKRDHELILHQFHLEFFQALILHHHECDVGVELFVPDDVQAAIDSLGQLMKSHSLGGIDALSESASNDEKSVFLLQNYVRANTKSVRNWGSYNQVKTIARELYGSLDESVVADKGFTFDEVFDVFEGLVKCIESRCTDRFLSLQDVFSKSSKQEVVYAYYELIDAGADKAEEFIEKSNLDLMSDESLRYALMAHYDLNYIEVFTFVSSEIQEYCQLEEACIEAVLNQYSMSKGDLTEHNIDYFFLDNPVWGRPLVRLDEDKYFSCIPQSFFSFVIPAIEGILDPCFKETVSDSRADFLEDKVSEIIKTRFPEANTTRSLKWTLESTEYETDIVACIDSHLLIIEAKSGKITEPALRGAPDRLKRHIKDIIVDPSEQSKRLRDRLWELKGNPNEEDSLRNDLPVSLESIQKIVRVSVSLEDFSIIQGNVPSLQETGWLPEDFEPCPNMNLADFETMFDFLEHPVQIIHYLVRRQEMENRYRLIGSELDFLGFYSQTLFSVGMPDPEVEYLLANTSEHISKYYDSKDAGITIDKPSLPICPTFKAVFELL